MWTDAETKLLLEIWSQDTIQRQLKGAFRNVNVFAQVVEELRKSGYHRTVQQCRIKIKSLKKKYKAVVDRARRSGAGNKSDQEEDLPSDFAYFSQIDAVMAGRPNVKPVHLLDSAFYEEEHEMGAGEREVVSPVLSPDQSVTPSSQPEIPSPSVSQSETPGPSVSQPETPGPSVGQPETPGPSVSQPQTPASSASWPETTTPSASQAPCQSDTNPGPSGSCQETPSRPGRSHSSSGKTGTPADDEAPHPKKKRKRVSKVQRAEKAGNVMMQELLAAHEEARKERMKWDKERSEIEDERDKIAAANDRQLMMSAMGQMMAFFTQCTGVSSTPYPPPFQPGYQLPSSPMPPFSAGYPPSTQSFQPFPTDGHPLYQPHPTFPPPPSMHSSDEED